VPSILRSLSSISAKIQNAYYLSAPPVSKYTQKSISQSKLTVNFKSKHFSNYSIHKVVGDLSTFFEKYGKSLNSHLEDIKEHQSIKVKEQ
jgi:hypothetical protein